MQGTSSSAAGRRTRSGNASPAARQVLMQKTFIYGQIWSNRTKMDKIIQNMFAASFDGFAWISWVIINYESLALAAIAHVPSTEMCQVDPSCLISPGVVGRDPGEDWIVPRVEPSEE